MDVLYFVLLLLAVVCFAAAAFRVAVARVELVALGLLFFALVPLFEAGSKL